MNALPDSEPESNASAFPSHGLPGERDNSLYEKTCYGGPSDHLRGQSARPIHGGTFITTENVIHQHVRGESGIYILHRAVALDALYDSADSFPQPRCHPETRTEMLDDLYEWVIADDSPHSIRWMHGPAGAGKSAIMQTLSQRLQDAGRLGGTFFFKRGHATRGNAKVLFVTVAYQLALHDPDLRPLISKSVEKDPSVVGRRMDVQLRKLIMEPVQVLANSASPILLIDGLDECETESAQLAGTLTITTEFCPRLS
ncbi:hypothetical protein C8R44DRAFT_395634 [Mycena epipterygia]|nr:hypothetical protein C8R44DRAFT_395634 [Mycena epipterygia]